MAKLLFTAEGQAREFDLAGKSRVVIGRHRECDVRIPDDSLSRKHAELRGIAGGGWEVHDLQSANGVVVEGRRVTTARLRSEQTIVLGTVEIRFFEEPASALPQVGRPGQRGRPARPSLLEEALELDDADLLGATHARAGRVSERDMIPETARRVTGTGFAGPNVTSPVRPITGPRTPPAPPVQSVPPAKDDQPDTSPGRPTRPGAGGSPPIAAAPMAAPPARGPAATAPTASIGAPVTANGGQSASELVRANDERATQEARIRNLVAEVAALREDLSASPSPGQLVALQRRVDEATVERDRTLARMSTLATEIGRWEARSQDWNDERTTLLARIETLEKSVQGAAGQTSRELATLRAERDAAQKDAAAAREFAQSQGERVDGLTDELMTMQRALEAQKNVAADAGRATTRVAALEERVAGQTARIHELEERLTAAQEAARQAADLSTALASAKAAQLATQARLDELLTSSASASNRSTEQRGRIQELERDLAHLRADLQDAQAQLFTRTSEQRAANEERERLQKRLDAMAAELMDAQAARAASPEPEDFNRLQSTVTELRGTMRRVTEERDALDARLLDAPDGETFRRLRAENARLLDEIQGLRDQTGSRAEADAEIARLRARNAQMKEAFNDLRAELETLLAAQASR